MARNVGSGELGQYNEKLWLLCPFGQLPPSERKSQLRDVLERHTTAWGNGVSTERHL